MKLKIMFKGNLEISFVGYYGYCKEISIADLDCGAKVDDCTFSAYLKQLSAGSCCLMSTSCKCQRMQAKVMCSLFYCIYKQFSLKLRQVWIVKQHCIKGGILFKADGSL